MNDQDLPLGPGAPDDERYAMHTLALTYDDGSGFSIEITTEEAEVVHGLLLERFETRMIEHVWDDSDLEPAECLATGWHLDQRKADGTCLYCGIGP